MGETANIIIADTLQGLGTDAYSGYLAHALCLSGICRLKYNGEERELRAGDLMIVRKGKLIDDIRPSDDFKVRTIYIKPGYIEICTPNSNYGMQGQLSLFLNPVMHLDEKQHQRCCNDFDAVETCMADSGHHFHWQMKINAVQRMILNFFDFHSHLHREDNISIQSASIMSRFLNMLENGTFRTCRDVSYYADKICITPKYLSEVSKKVSGYPANYWIKRYTILDISRLLRDKTLTIAQISDLFGFSSTSHFSRYVRQNLGINPAAYRE